MPKFKRVPDANQLHILVFDQGESWTGWLEDIAGKGGYKLTIEEYSSPREIFMRMVSQLPHLLLIDLNCSESEVQQVLGFVERTCSFLPMVGLHRCAHPDLMEWQRNILPGLVSWDQPDQMLSFFEWASSLKQDGHDQARRMRIMQQIEQNLQALQEMDSFFEAGSRLPTSYSQQTRKEIASSKKYLEMLREKLRDENRQL